MTTPKDPKDTPQPAQDEQLDDKQLENVSGGALAPVTTTKPTTTGGTAPILNPLGGRGVVPCI